MIPNFFIRRLQYNQQTRRFFLTIIALGFVIDGVYAVLLNLYLLRLGYDARFIGEVNSFGLLTFALVSLPAGIMGTRWASSSMMRFGLASMLLGTFLLPLAEFSPPGWQEGWLIVTYALILSGFSLFFVNSAPFLMNVVTRDQQNGAFAMQTALLALAAFAGSLFGGMLPGIIGDLAGMTLDDPAPYRYTLLLVAAAVAVAFLLMLTIVEPPAPETEETPPATVTPRPRLRSFATPVIMLVALMSIIRFLQVAGMATTSVYFNVFLDTQYALPPSSIGAIASLGRLLSVPAVLLAPVLIRRTSTGSVAFWAAVLTALCLVPIALASSWWVAAVGYIGALATTNVRFAAFIVYALALVPKRQQAVMAGMGEMAAGFSFATMALGGGYIITLASFRELFLLGAILTGLGALIFGLHLRGVSLRRPAQVGTLP